MPQRKFSVNFGTLDQDVLDEIMSMQKKDGKAVQSRKGRRVNQADQVSALVEELERLRINLKDCPALLATSLTREFYSPSHVALNSLTCIGIPELILEHHHLGNFVIVRVLIDPVQFHAALAVIEDEAGNCTRLQIYCLDFNFHPSNLLPRGSVIAIKEPFFEVLSNDRQAIRLDHPSDFIRLCPSDSRVPLKWREQMEKKSPQDFKAQGNKLVARKDWAMAEFSYTQGLEHGEIAEGSDVSTALHLNRALARLQLNRFEEALQDTEKVLGIQKFNEKALFRSAQAFYKIGRYQKSASRVNTLLKHYPDNRESRVLLGCAEDRLMEERNGQYDIPAMLARIIIMPHIDAATFVGAVTVTASSRHGRGLFAKSPFAAGDLILCEKACISAFKGDILMSKFAEAVGDFNSGRAMDAYQHVSINQMINHCSNNPTIHSKLLLLHDGGYPRTGHEGTVVDGKQVVDTFLLRCIFELNAFGCPRKSSDDISLNTSSKALDHDSVVRSSGGIWQQIAFTNHSCLPNGHASFVGDMMMLRAIRNIAEGEEILISYVRSNLDYPARKALLSKWGFECSCELCEADMKDESKMSEKRRALLTEFSKAQQSLSTGAISLEAIENASQIIHQLERTYLYSIWSNLPRRAVYSPCLILASFYIIIGTRGAIPDAVALARAEEFALKALSSLGYELEIQKEGLKVLNRTASLCVNEAVNAFILLANAQYGLERGHLVPTFMKEVALTYKMLCGEDWSLKERLGMETLKLEMDSMMQRLDV